MGATSLPLLYITYLCHIIYMGPYLALTMYIGHIWPYYIYKYSLIFIWYIKWYLHYYVVYVVISLSLIMVYQLHSNILYIWVIPWSLLCIYIGPYLGHYIMVYWGHILVLLCRVYRPYLGHIIYGIYLSLIWYIGPYLNIMVYGIHLSLLCGISRSWPYYVYKYIFILYFTVYQ
jgi:hypothetical protein